MIMYRLLFRFVFLAKVFLQLNRYDIQKNGHMYDSNRVGGSGMSITPATGVNATTINNLFSALSSNQSEISALAQGAMSQGAALYSKGNYAAAESAFRTSIALDPSADNAPQAYDLLATAYIANNDTQDAIKAYQTSLTISPNDDNAYEKLGNIYYSQKDYSDAEKDYKAAVQISPTSSADLYALGEVDLATGDTQDAEKTFQHVINMDPSQYGGYYALGQTYSKEGDQQDAINAFEKVVSLNPTFTDVHVDLGEAYADLGDTNDAQNQVTYLNDYAPNLAPVLTAYMTKVEQPSIDSTYSTTGFSTFLGPGTPVSELDPALTSPNATTVMNMVFVFNKSMDANSVQNPANWTISKSTATTPGGAYNWGLPAPQTDVPISPTPLSVVYDSNSDTATVSFLIIQNAGANGTIDPSHVTFQFNGTDADGNAMNPKAYEYNGVSMIV